MRRRTVRPRRRAASLAPLLSASILADYPRPAPRGTEGAGTDPDADRREARLWRGAGRGSIRRMVLRAGERTAPRSPRAMRPLDRFGLEGSSGREVKLGWWFAGAALCGGRCGGARAGVGQGNRSLAVARVRAGNTMEVVARLVAHMNAWLVVPAPREGAPGGRSPSTHRWRHGSRRWLASRPSCGARNHAGSDHNP